MSAPKNRAELVEVMAARLWFREFSMPWDKATRIQKDRFYRSARDTLETLEAAGVALVPVVATDAMLRAGWNQIDWHRPYDGAWDQEHPEGGTSQKEDMTDAHGAMVAASPYAPNPEARSDGE